MTEDLIRSVVSDIVEDELAQFTDGLETRLTDAMTKALDTVLEDVRSNTEARLRQLEEDQARIMRHLGLSDDV